MTNVGAVLVAVLVSVGLAALITWLVTHGWSDEGEESEVVVPEPRSTSVSVVPKARLYDWQSEGWA